MGKVYKSVEELVGRTPLMEVTNIEKELGLKGKILVKLESFNPAGSAKDRVAKKMIEDATADGRLKPGATIIEPTSGNTGIGLASLCAALGYRSIFVMPETMSEERIKLLRGYGAEIHLTKGEDGMAGSIAYANALAEEIEGAFIPGQFENPSNPKAHYETTGPEIYEDTQGEVDVLVAGVGTGGTLSGTGKYLKEQKASVQVVGMEPASSPVITKGVAGAHKIQGIGANFVPENFDKEICDEMLTVTDEDAFYGAKLMARKEGILVGISSGAALMAAVELAKRPAFYGKTIVVVMTDTGERYLSTPLFD